MKKNTFISMMSFVNFSITANAQLYETGTGWLLKVFERHARHGDKISTEKLF